MATPVRKIVKTRIEGGGDGRGPATGEAVEARDGFTELERLIAPPTSPPPDLHPSLNPG